MAETTGSRYFRLQRFRALMKRHLATSGRFDGRCLTVDTAVGGFLGLVGGKQTTAIQIDSAADSLFQSDWEDLSIRVFQREFFAQARSLAEAYEQLTQQAVTLICHFELDLGDG
ncbi:hypothetical protein U5801_20835 [Lamprobacter modestohalophilus]|uniref:hypothetical protein n=1 Tax=Lamprobacter modestohalophilus TaxID=1064514 RepID=UPI002ADEFABF|nr:hypothetical protein [Lamprobacter modestohalophilus]MEA1052231.1 hypothetical protein [Lamprobacter modestohalophilus]